MKKQEIEKVKTLLKKYNDILLNTGLNSVTKNKCLNRDMGMWKIDLSEVIGRS